MSHLGCPYCCKWRQCGQYVGNAAGSKPLRALSTACESPELPVQQLAVMSKGATMQHCLQHQQWSMLMYQCLHAPMVSHGAPGRPLQQLGLMRKGAVAQHCLQVLLWCSALQLSAWCSSLSPTGHSGCPTVLSEGADAQHCLQALTCETYQFSGLCAGRAKAQLTS